MKNHGKSVVIMIIVILAGMVVGGVAGNALVSFAKSNGISWLNWLVAGVRFGITDPFSLDLGILKFVLGFTIEFTISGIIGMVGAAFIYKKL